MQVAGSGEVMVGDRVQVLFKFCSSLFKLEMDRRHATRSGDGREKAQEEQANKMGTPNRSKQRKRSSGKQMEQASETTRPASFG